VSSINNSGKVAGYYVTNTPFGETYSAFTDDASNSSFTTLSRPGSLALGGSGINSAGDVVGVSVDATLTATGFLRDAMGNYSTIDPAAHGITSAYSEAVGINDNGYIVGFYKEIAPTPTVDQPSHGFVDNNGTYFTLDVGGAVGTEL
jgi:hypothetical protein